jgi:hypothetical protein
MVLHKNNQKQAILVTAYKNYHHLEEIVSFFNDNFEIFIHIDRNSSISSCEINKLEKYSNVKLIAKKYKVNWGGYNHLQCILFLVNEALKSNENIYFHLISGHDYPIKNIQSFDYFLENQDQDFIDCFSVPFIGWGELGGYDRLQYFSFYDLFNWKNIVQRKWIKKIINLQIKFGYKRSFPKKFPSLYGGSTWWSLSRESLLYVVRYTNANQEFLKRFKYTFCAEEFYFQTILMTSYRKSSIVNSNLRYIDWSNRNGNNPSILDITDLSKLLLSDSFFARRFDYPISAVLMQNLKTNLHDLNCNTFYE